MEFSQELRGLIANHYCSIKRGWQAGWLKSCGYYRWSVTNVFNSVEAYGMPPLARINLWALKGTNQRGKSLFQRKMNYKACSLPGKYDYDQSMVQTLFISTLSTCPFHSFAPLCRLWRMMNVAQQKIKMGTQFRPGSF